MSITNPDSRPEQDLYIAARQGEASEVQRLLRCGANPSWRCTWPSDGDCALHAAVGEGHDAIVYVLLQHGADVKHHDDKLRNVLHKAAENGRLNLLKKFVTMGVEVNSSDWNGVTPLHLAIASGHADCVKHLLENGADPERKSCTYGVPLIQAAGYNHLACVELLLHHGANVNIYDNDMSQAIHAAANFNHPESLKLLLDHGCEFDGMDDEGRSPLFLAAEGEHLECVTLLVQRGADCIAAATFAAQARQWRTVEVLLQRTESCPPDEVLLRAVQDVRLSTTALCVQRGVWPAEEDIVAYLVTPVARQGDLYHNDAVEEEWLAHIYTDSRLTDLIEMLEMLHETGLISSRTFYQQMESVEGGDRDAGVFVPLTLKNLSSCAVRRCVRKHGGEVYEELGLPHALVEFVACQHLVEQYENIPKIEWDSGGDSDSD